MNEDTVLSIVGVAQRVDGTPVDDAASGGERTLSQPGGRRNSAGANGTRGHSSGTQAQIKRRAASITIRQRDFNGGDTLTVVSTDATARRFDAVASPFLDHDAR